MAALNWEKDRRAALWRKGKQMAREERQAVNRVTAPAKYREGPASERQIEYLQALRRRASLPPLDKIDALKLTKSQASEAIKKLLPPETV